ncbi:hypothetical protein JKP88DRAFT_322921 [Tribonema minus]|uniref:Cilia- and flagella-associated protein 53 n=1 Tax=Tribonema minus TaxID=303371 RepID=A0A835YTH0_9STRA|nr:hypothetical protein JKP88DRAFT_322921 [Tribonema minus]
MFGPNPGAVRAVNTHQGRFEKTRAQERQLENSIASINKTRAALQYATWENKTHDAIAARQGRDRMTRLTEADKAALEGRRRRLAAQRQQEMAEWEHEVLNRTETLEQRKERIREKATKLRDAREAARKQFVQDMYDKQWRDSCDASRTLDSKAFLDWVNAQREQQLEEKALRLAREAEEDAQYTAQIYERMAWLEAQEREREETRRRTAEVVKDGLTAQVRYNAARRMALEQRSAEEDRLELDELRAIVAAEEQKERDRTQAAHARGAQVREFNKDRQRLREEAAALEQQRDMALLKYAVDRERAGEAEEHRKRDAEREAMRQYTAYLKAQMEREAEDAGKLDTAQADAETKMWEAREAEQAKRADARRALMAQVHAARQEQIRARRLADAAERAALNEQAAFDREAFARAEAQEADKERERRAALLDQAAKLRGQVDERAAARARERQEEYLSMKRMEACEREHKARLEAQSGKVVLHHPLKHTQWYT